MASINIYGGSYQTKKVKEPKRYREVIQTGQKDPVRGRTPKYQAPPQRRPNTRPTSTSGPGNYIRALGGATNIHAAKLDAESRRSS